MRKPFTKKIVSVALCAVMFAAASVSGLAGCGEEEKTESGYVVATKHAAEDDKVYALTFPDAIGKDVMPVGSYAGPHSEDRVYKGQNLPSMVSESYFELYKEMGLNFFTSTLNANDGKVQEFLTLCDEYNMGAFITFDELFNTTAANYMSVAKIEDNLGLFAEEHKSLIGFNLRDEPTEAEIEILKTTSEQFAESSYADTHYIYANALPAYGVDGSWEAYLRAYCEKLQVKYLSFDFYPWHINPKTGEEAYNSGYVKALSVSRKVANEFKIPVWSCKQAGSIFEGLSKDLQKITPDENKFRWQMSIDLAYGVKGFTYFLLCGDALSYDENVWEEGIDDYFGIFNAFTGEPNIWFDYAKEFDKHLTIVEKILMNSCHDGIITCGTVKEKHNIGDELIESGSYHELESVSGNPSIIGCYNYKGQTVLYVSNNSYSANGTVTLNFKDNYGYTVYQKDNKADKTGKSITLELLPGEGAMVALKYA